MDAQGGCERTKNTVFPEAVSVITRLLVWGLAFLLFLATLGPKGWDGLVTTVAVATIAMGFIWIDAMGRDLKDPFEGTPNDIPMNALSVTIERDLLQMLGETKLPEPVRPVKGVLKDKLPGGLGDKLPILGGKKKDAKAEEEEKKEKPKPKDLLKRLF